MGWTKFPFYELEQQEQGCRREPIRCHNQVLHVDGTLKKTKLSFYHLSNQESRVISGDKSNVPPTMPDIWSILAPAGYKDSTLDHWDTSSIKPRSWNWGRIWANNGHYIEKENFLNWKMYLAFSVVPVSRKIEWT